VRSSCVTPSTTSCARSAGIGFGVRPSARRRGLARWSLAAVLPRARSLGLGRVLVSCDDDNFASARTIEANGGVLEDVRRLEDGPKRLYWIDLTSTPVEAARA
jgi:predicted acetyltransferase